MTLFSVSPKFVVERYVGGGWGFITFFQLTFDIAVHNYYHYYCNATFVGLFSISLLRQINYSPLLCPTSQTFHSCWRLRGHAPTCHECSSQTPREPWWTRSHCSWSIDPQTHGCHQKWNAHRWIEKISPELCLRMKRNCFLIIFCGTIQVIGL